MNRRKKADMIPYLILSIILGLGSILPSFRLTHWVFRSFDFFRVQLLIIQFILFVGGFFLINETYRLLVISQMILIISIAYQIIIIVPYLKFGKSPNYIKQNEPGVSILSVNVLQKNTNYQTLIDLIFRIRPDIVLTMETNKKWEKALEKIERDYPFCLKIPKENSPAAISTPRKQVWNAFL